MTKEYVEKLAILFRGIHSKKIKDFEIKHFFSGAAVYAQGKICITWSPAGFAIKLPSSLRDELLKERGVKELRYFSKGHIKKEYVVLPKRILDDKRLLTRLIKRSFEYVT